MVSLYQLCGKLPAVFQKELSALQNIGTILRKMPLIKLKYLKKRFCFRFCVSAAASAAALYENLRRAKGRTALKSRVRFSAVALAACTALLCESGSAYNSADDNTLPVMATSQVVKTQQTCLRVSACRNIKLAAITPLPLIRFPAEPAFVGINADTCAAAANTTDTLAPTEGDFSGDPFDSPQCTWYVWGRVKAMSGITLAFKDTSGRSAKYWLNEVAQTGSVQVIRDKKAVRTNSIAVFRHGGNGNGHVVVVENVIRDSGGDPISIVLSESNWGKQKCPSRKRLSWSEFLNRSDGSLKGYIYF
jgi:hypothetical protein